MRRFNLLVLLQFFTYLAFSIFFQKGVFAFSPADAPISFALFSSTVTNFPYQIAIDSGGYVYVADTGANAIRKYDSSGNFILSFGSAFSGPTGVGVASNGNIIMANFQQDKIETYSNTGTLLSTFGSSGSGNNQFSGPYAIAVDSAGNIFVCDSFNNRVQKFNSSMTYQSTITGSGSAFSSPESVAIDGSDNLYVLDSGNNRVQVFTSSGTFVRNVTGNGGAWNFPEGMTVDTFGNLFVADSANDRVQVFNSSGTFQQTFGSSGTALGQFQYATGMAMTSNGVLYISDENRIQKAIFDRTVPAFSIANPPPSSLNTGGSDVHGSTTDDLTNITAIQYNLNSAGWTNCTIQDGSLNSTSEGFTCSFTLSTLGANTLSVRSTDSKTNTNTVTYNINVSAPPSGPPPPGPTTTPPGSAPVIFSSTSTDTSITLNFSPAQDPVTGYILYYGTDPNNLEFGIPPFGDTNTTSYTVSGLSPGTTYYFELIAVNGPATGPASPMFSAATTGATPTALASPEPESTPSGEPGGAISTPEPEAVTPELTGEPEPRDITVTDVFGSPVSGVEMQIQNEEGSIIAEGTTGEAGVIDATLAPGVYSATSQYDGSTFNNTFTANRGIPDIAISIPIVNSEILGIPSVVTITPRKADEVIKSSTYIAAAGTATAFAVGTVSTAAIAISSLVPLYIQIGRSILNFPFDLAKAVGSWQMKSGLYFIGSLSGVRLYKKKHEGVIFDTLFSKPIPFAMIMLYSDTGNLTTTFADAVGSFRATPKPDLYNLKVEKPEFKFPSKIFTGHFSESFGRVYVYGQKIEVTEEKPIVANISVPLDPEKLEGIRKVVSNIRKVLTKTLIIGQTPLAVVGIAISMYAALFYPTILNKSVFAFLLFYLIAKFISNIYVKASANKNPAKE